MRLHGWKELVKAAEGMTVCVEQLGQGVAGRSSINCDCVTVDRVTSASSNGYSQIRYADCNGTSYQLKQIYQTRNTCLDRCSTLRQLGKWSNRVRQLLNRGLHAHMLLSQRYMHQHSVALYLPVVSNTPLAWISASTQHVGFHAVTAPVLYPAVPYHVHAVP